MSISNQNQKVSRSGDGTSHQFSFDFRIAQAADLVVIVRNDTTGVAVTKTLDTHYIIPTSSVNAASGGNILFKFNTGTSTDAHYSTTDSRPQNGETIIIKRVVQLTQGVDLQAADSLPANTLEDAYDKLTFGLQQVQEQLGRALLRPASDSTTATLPDNIDLKGKVLQFNSSTGVPEAVAGLTNVATSSVDGLMSAADKSKVDGIEAGATGDQDAAEIRTLVESASDSNVFTDSDHSKLNSIESSATADQTDSEIKTAYENNADTNALTDTLLAKLNNIEANATADQTDAQIKTAYENNANTNAFTDADHSKLDGIEASATADQDASEIRALVESATDSNVFTDADHSKLNAIEAGATADQTASDIRGLGFFDTSNDGTGSGLDADKLDGQEGTYYQAASTALTTSTSFGGDVSGAYNAIVIADDSHNHVISNVDNLQTSLDAKAPLASPALTGTPTAPTASADTSTTQIATTAFVQQELAELIDSAPNTLNTLNEIAAAINDDPNFNTTVTTSLSNRLRIDVNNQSLTETQKSNATTNLGLSAVATSGAYSDISGTPSAATTGTAGLMSAADKTKLDGVESNATADQTASEIKTLYENNSNTNALTDALLSKLNAIEASATADQTASEIRTLVESASDSNVFTDADHSKLNAIEASATADQTAAEIRALVESATDSNVFTDNDHSKLNAIEASATADQTAADIRGLGFFDTSNDGATSGLDSDLLDGQHGSYYLDYSNFTNVPTLTTTLSALTDTTISSVGDNDLIAYDSSSSKFINQTPAEAGFATVATSGAYSDLSGTPTIPSTLTDLTLDLNGNELILDLDGDTSITSDTDDEIHFKIGGSDELVLDFGYLRPHTDRGLNLGSAGRKWHNLYVDQGNFVDINISDQVNSQVTTKAPFIIASTIKVANLNVDKLDDQEGSYYLDYGNFSNTPTIPTNNNQLSNGSGYLTSVPAQSFSSLTGKPTTISGFGITDAFDGAYGSLTGTPTIPTAVSDLTNDSGFITSVPAQSFSSLTGKPTTIAGYGITDALSNIADVSGGVSVTGDLTTDEVFLANSTDHKIGKVNHLYGDGIGLTTDNATVTIGAGNSSYIHYISSGGQQHFFNTHVNANGNFYVYSDAGSLIWINNRGTDHEVTLTTTTPSAARTITLPDATGTVALNESGILNLTNSGSQSEVRLYCESNNAHYAALKAPAHSDFSGDVTLTLPNTDGTLINSVGNTSIQFLGASNAHKIQFWNSTNTYTMGMDSGRSFGSIGGESTEYAIVTTMSNSDHRGFVWRDTGHTAGQGAMSLTTTGKMTVADSIRVGYGESDSVVSGTTHDLEVNGSFSAAGLAYPSSDGSNGQVLTTNGSGTLSFTTVSGGGGSSTLNGLTDVSVSSPSNGQVLKYVSAQSRWEAADETGGGGGSSTNADTVDNLHLSVVSTMPSSPNSSTIYFVTG